MSPNRPLAVSVGLAAGLVAAVGFYTAAAGADAPKAQPKAQPTPAAKVVTPKPEVTFAPCVKPAKLEHGACVTHKVVTKVVNPPASPVVAVPRPSVSTSGRGTASLTQPAVQDQVTAADAQKAAADAQAAAEKAAKEAQDAAEKAQEDSSHGSDSGDDSGDDSGKHGDD